MSIIGEYFNGELEDLLKILLDRQQQKNKQFNTEIAYSYSDMLLIHDNHKKSDNHPLLIDASKHLNKIAYQCFFAAYKQSFYYTMEESDDGTILVC